MVHVPTTAAKRKSLPVCTGVLDYFPDALLAVAEVSRIGNDQHNPGEPLHWAKEKSTDEPDSLLRHLIDRGKLDVDGVRHSAKVAWRALALLQREIDAEKAAMTHDSEKPPVCTTDNDEVAQVLEELAGDLTKDMKTQPPHWGTVEEPQLHPIRKPWGRIAYVGTRTEGSR